MSRSEIFTKMGFEDLQEGKSKKNQPQGKFHTDHRVLMGDSIRLNNLTDSTDLAGHQNQGGPLRIDQMLPKRAKINKRLTYNFNHTN